MMIVVYTHALRFPATVVAALQIAMLCAMKFPSTMEDMTMDQVEGLLNMILGQVKVYVLDI